MGNDNPSTNFVTQGTNDVLVGEAVEAITVYTFMPKAPRKGKPLGNLRHVAVKSSIEAHHLTQFGVVFSHRIDSLDLAGQVQGGEGDKLPQGQEELRGYDLRGGIIWPAMDQTVSDPIRSRKAMAVHCHYEHSLDRLAVIEKIPVPVGKTYPRAVFEPEPTSWHANTFHRALCQQLLLWAESVKGKFDRGRTTVDAEDMSRHRPSFDVPQSLPGLDS